MRGSSGVVGRAVAQFEAASTTYHPNQSVTNRKQQQSYAKEEEIERLRTEVRELREHNELLEFRLLEKQSDNVSDSGVSDEDMVLSLVTREPTLLSPLSMHESGIFDTIIIETESKCTQTDVGQVVEAGLPELQKEVQKLLKFRETISELKPEDFKQTATSSPNCQQCNNFLNNQDYKIKELTEKVIYLTKENRRLEEEKCEFEEAENDARLISQRLEGKVSNLMEERELLHNQIRRITAERASINRQAKRWETLASQLEERNFELEETDVEIKFKLSQLEEILPGLLVFMAYITKQKFCKKSYQLALPAPCISTSTQTMEEQFIDNNEIIELREKVNAYSETLRLADELWANTERHHQSILKEAEEKLIILKDRVIQLEEQLTRLNDIQDSINCLEKRNEQLQKSERRLQQHIHELESNEMALRDELTAVQCGCNAKERRLLHEISRAKEETEDARNELHKVREEFSLQLTTIKRKYEQLRQELHDKQELLKETQTALLHEEKRTRMQRRRTTAIIAEAECTNSELREEVDTLETSVRHLRGQLEAQNQSSERVILKLNLQLSARDRELTELRKELEYAGAHENGLIALAQRATLASQQLQTCKKCSNIQGEVREIASQLRVLSDIVSGRNYESEDEIIIIDEKPIVPPRRHLSSAGSRVRAAHKAIIKATKSAIMPCPMSRSSELVSR